LSLLGIAGVRTCCWRRLRALVRWEIGCAKTNIIPHADVACRCALAVLMCVLADACGGRVRPSGPGNITGASFVATAYCTGRRTASGATPTRDTVAADVAVLPMGTRIRVSGLAERYNGLYVVRDTGSQIRGRRIDVYMHDCDEAVRFGRRSVRVSVVR